MHAFVRWFEAAMDTILDCEYNNIMVGGVVVKLHQLIFKFDASLIYLACAHFQA